MEWDGTFPDFGNFTIAESFAYIMWANDDSKTKFKVRETVIYKEKEYKIIGVDDNEYALDYYAFIVWEHELTKIGELK